MSTATTALRQTITSRVAEEIRRCDEYIKTNQCGKCVRACPAAKEKGIADDISELNRQTVSSAEPTGAIREYALSCMQTAKCTAPCPIGLDRSQMMLVLKSRIQKLPPEYQKFNFIRGTDISPLGKAARLFFNFKQNWKIGRKLARYNDGKITRQNVDLLFYFGCYLNSKKICHDTFKIADQLGEDYAVLGGLSTCCGWPQYFQGQFDLAERYLQNLKESIEKYQPKRIATTCMECFAALVYVKEKYQMDFLPITTTTWIKQNLAQLNLSKSETTAIFHDSCQRCHRLKDCQSARQILGQVVKETKEFPSNKEKSLCCAHWDFGYNPRNRRLVETKISQVKSSKADLMMVECLTCEETYEAEAKKQGITVQNIVGFVADQLR